MDINSLCILSWSTILVEKDKNNVNFLLKHSLALFQKARYVTDNVCFRLMREYLYGLNQVDLSSTATGRQTNRMIFFRVKIVLKSATIIKIENGMTKIAMLAIISMIAMLSVKQAIKSAYLSIKNYDIFLEQIRFVKYETNEFWNQY